MRPTLWNSRCITARKASSADDKTAASRSPFFVHKNAMSLPYAEAERLNQIIKMENKSQNVPSVLPALSALLFVSLFVIAVSCLSSEENGLLGFMICFSELGILVGLALAYSLNNGKEDQYVVRVAMGLSLIVLLAAISVLFFWEIETRDFLMQYSLDKLITISTGSTFLLGFGLYYGLSTLEHCFRKKWAQ